MWSIYLRNWIDMVLCTRFSPVVAPAVPVYLWITIDPGYIPTISPPIPPTEGCQNCRSRLRYVVACVSILHHIRSRNMRSTQQRPLKNWFSNVWMKPSVVLILYSPVGVIRKIHLLPVTIFIMQWRLHCLIYSGLVLSPVVLSPHGSCCMIYHLFLLSFSHWFLPKLDFCNNH